jgi:hypothetical protein
MIEICKMLFDLCFYYTLSGFYLYIFTQNHPSGWGVPVLMLPAIIFIALKKRKPSIKSLREKEKETSLPVVAACCVLPALVFLFGLSIWQILQFLPAWAFLGYAIWKNRIYLRRGEFERHFFFTLKVLGTMALGLAVIRRVEGALTGAVPYMIVYLLTGVCLMRELREEGKLTGGRNIAVLLTLLAGSIALTVLQTPQLLLGAVGFVYRNIIVNIILGVAFVIGFIGYGIIWVLTRLFRFSATDVREEPDPGEMGWAFQDDRGGWRALQEIPTWLEVALTALLALAVAYVLFRIMRRMLGAKTEQKVLKIYTEEHEKLQKKERGVRGGIIRPKDPRLAVRWYYRKYLREGVSRGALPDPADTSLSIRQKYATYFREAPAGRLRELYVNARYQYGRAVTKSDVDSASKAWRELKQD